MMKRFKVDLLPNRVFWPDQETKVDLSEDNNWNTVLNSIQAYTSEVAVPVIKEHTPDGGAFGKVESVFEEDGKIKANIQLTSQSLIEEMESGDKEYNFVSPRISWNYKDIDGNNWPAALLELSLVSVPRSLFQDKIQELPLNTKEDNKELEIQLSEKLNMPVYMANLTEIEGDTNMSEDMKTELKAMVAEMIAEAFAKQADNEDKKEDAIEDEAKSEAKMACDETKMAEVEVEVEDEVEPEEEAIVMSELEDLKAAYETLKAEYENMKAAMEKSKEDAIMSEVKSDIAKRGMDLNKLSGFISLYKVDRPAYESAMSAIPVKSSVGTKVDFSGKGNSVTKLALELQKSEGITYKEALKRASAQIAK